MKYAFIKQHAEEFPISICCDVLEVGRSGYYDWLQHRPGKQEIANRRLDAKITALYTENNRRYGAPRIFRALNNNGEACSRNRVTRRLKALGLQAVGKRKFKATTDSNHSKPLYDNVLKRDFTTSHINEKWCGDITYIRTSEGWMYCAVVIDLQSRAVVGWSMDKRMKKALVCNALIMALKSQGFPKRLIMHTDRGSQYCSKRYRKMIVTYKLIGSMSRKGNCWDNAIAESFFHTLKVELIYQQVYKTRDMAKQSVFHYIETYYNRKRLHSAIGYKTPSQVLMAA